MEGWKDAILQCNYYINVAIRILVHDANQI